MPCILLVCTFLRIEGNVCMYVCMYVCTYVCIYVCMHCTYVRMYVCMYAYVFMYCTYVRLYVCTYALYVRTYVCMYACMYCTYVRMYVCMYRTFSNLIRISFCRFLKRQNLVRGSHPHLSFNRPFPKRQTDWIILYVTNALTVIRLTRRVWSGHLTAIGTNAPQLISTAAI